MATVTGDCNISVSLFKLRKVRQEKEEKATRDRAGLQYFNRENEWLHIGHNKVTWNSWNKHRDVNLLGRKTAGATMLSTDYIRGGHGFRVSKEKPKSNCILCNGHQVAVPVERFLLLLSGPFFYWKRIIQGKLTG